jgi:hypothetical protein
MEELPPRMRALLWEQKTMVMATDQDGKPWIASVFCAPSFEGGRLRVICALLGTSRKLTNLRLNPAVAVYIGPQEPTIWFQGSGTAAIIEDEQAAQPALNAVKTHAPPSAAWIDSVPVVAVEILVEQAKLTDLTGGKPPVETWTDPAGRS